MPTRNVNLTPALDAFVDASVESGTYQNASEVLRDGLRTLQRRKREDAIRLKALRESLDEGIAALERGDFVQLTVDELGPYLSKLGRASKKPKRR